MKIIIDEREPHIFSKCQDILAENPHITDITISKCVLTLGDMIIETNDGKIITMIERKNLSDLLASIKDGRYEEQSLRLSHNEDCSPNQITYIIEGMLNVISSQTEKKQIYSAMTSLHFYKGFNVVRTCSQMETAEFLIFTADKMNRNQKKGVKEFGSSSEITNTNYCNVVKKTKKDNITKENIGEILLCQIPGISSITSIAIMKNFSSFNEFIAKLKENPIMLDEVVIETNGKKRKINKTCIKSIQEMLL